MMVGVSANAALLPVAPATMAPVHGVSATSERCVSKS
jgi:hypothetical protein